MIWVEAFSALRNRNFAVLVHRLAKHLAAEQTA
jgi:hypothetical protein